MLHPQSHKVVINCSSLNSGRAQRAGDGYIHTLGKGAIDHARPLIGVLPTIDITTARSPHLRESSYIHLSVLSSVNRKGHWLISDRFKMFQVLTHRTLRKLAKEMEQRVGATSSSIRLALVGKDGLGSLPSI